MAHFIQHNRGQCGRRGALARELYRWRMFARSTASTMVCDPILRGVAEAGRRSLLAKPSRYGIEVLRDIPYLDGGREEHLLDVYRPASGHGPWPVVLYVHGGAFAMLTKDTHWIMATTFARFGFMVVNISYRLAPTHPFPAAVQDACAAYEWLVANAERYGGDLERLLVAGESAGANLVSSLALATCYRRPEAWAQRVFDLAVTPRVVVPACGLLQASDGARFARRRRMPRWLSAALEDCSRMYLQGADLHRPEAIDLADPLCVLERGDAPDRHLPAFFIPVGTKDPLLDDTRRMARALERLEVPHEARYYEGELHAFHALVWRRQARRCWRDMFSFVDQHMHKHVRARNRATDRAAAGR